VIRRRTVVLAVLALAVGFFALRQWRDHRALERRFDCPDDIGAVLPDGDAPLAPEVPLGVRVEQFTELEQPVGMATRDGDDALYFIEQTGRVKRWASGTTDVVVDLSKEVTSGREQGLLGITFSPDGRKLYTDHTDLEGDTRVTEWSLDDGIATNRREVLFVDDPHRWHNGGQLAFGPDAKLYIGQGDGGGKADEYRNGQRRDALLGKILRIDPTPQGARSYSVPRDNPFVGDEDAAPEVWAYGLRNPWRFTFDSDTGDLWIADVGDGCFEELDLERAGFDGGANYGWRRTEGAWVIDEPVPEDYVAPVYTYRRDGARTCAVVGGYVYRGALMPALDGWYVFGDFCHGQLMVWRGPGTGQPIRLGPAVFGLSSFGVDPAGELYAMSLAGGVFRLLPADPGG
jgi:glucose/arabinose dehydrogenase